MSRSVCAMSREGGAQGLVVEEGGEKVRAVSARRGVKRCSILEGRKRQKEFVKKTKIPLTHENIRENKFLGRVVSNFDMPSLAAAFAASFAVAASGTALRGLEEKVLVGFVRAPLAAEPLPTPPCPPN